MNEVPSTPSELFNLNHKSTYDTALQAIRDLPLNDAMNAVEEILGDLYHYHSDLLEEAPDRGTERIWEKECDYLLTARNAVRSVSRSCECEDCKQENK